MKIHNFYAIPIMLNFKYIVVHEIGHTNAIYTMSGVKNLKKFKVLSEECLYR